MENKEEENEIKDIFEGEQLQVWDDGEFITLAFGLITIAVPKDEGIWDELKEDLKKFVKNLN